MTKRKILVCGAGGFIGGHMVRRLIEQGNEVRAIDIKPLQDWFQISDAAESRSLDLSLKENCETAVDSCDHIYNFAADMGGIGFIEQNKSNCMLNVLINTHLLMAARRSQPSRYLFSSTACVYPEFKQNTYDAPKLKESDAYPAMPEDGYGWEKLFGERMCRHFREDHGLETRIVRFHNVYGPLGTWTGGREKAPAAICRKVIEAKRAGQNFIDVWGDGRQVRSFLDIEDCLTGTQLVMEGGHSDPLNIGSDEDVTIEALVRIVEDIAGVKLEHRSQPDAPKGVAGRNCDGSEMARLFNWRPKVALRDGMKGLYAWIERQMAVGK